MTRLPAEVARRRPANTPPPPAPPAEPKLEWLDWLALIATPETALVVGVATAFSALWLCGLHMPGASATWQLVLAGVVLPYVVAALFVLLAYAGTRLHSAPEKTREDLTR